VKAYKQAYINWLLSMQFNVVNAGEQNLIREAHAFNDLWHTEIKFWILKNDLKLYKICRKHAITAEQIRLLKCIECS
jgi:hypothetical protein